MLLQLAIDRPEGLSVIRQVADLVDILEVGTPMLNRFGLAVISTFHELAPGVPLLVDAKVVDGGTQEAEMVFNAGATLMTVLSSASGATLRAAAEVAGKYGAYIVIDTIGGGADSLPERSAYPEQCAWVALHVSSDARKAGDAHLSAQISAVTRMHDLGYRVALAGGINRADLDAAVSVAPEILVIGSAITNDVDPRGTTEWILSRLPDRGRGWSLGMK